MRWMSRNAVLGLLFLPALGCTDRDSGILLPAPANDDPIVFDDNFGAAVRFEAFAGSRLDALVGVDATVAYSGTASLKVNVPAIGEYAGGAFPTDIARDLTGYNALTFWARASRDVNLNTIGYGNDNTGNSLYEASSDNFALTTNWTKFIVPIPNPDRLAIEKGLFFFAEADETTGYELWFDEIRFENVTGVSNERPILTTDTIDSFVGAPLSLGGQTTFEVDGEDRTVVHSARYFEISSSNEDVATVDAAGIVELVGTGDAVLTASLKGIPATGEVTLSVSGAPTAPAPVPSQAAADVVSLFSGPYPDVTVERFSTDWDWADVLDFSISGDAVKVFQFQQFSWNGTAIEFTAPTVDVSDMTHFHMDVWVPNDTSLRVKLVDFGPNGVFGGDDAEHELTFNAGSTPPLTSGEWVSLDLPLTDFTGLVTTSNLAQLILSGETATLATLFVDNIYFYR